MSTATTTDARSDAHGHTRDRERPTGTKCRTACVSPTPAQAHCAVCHRTLGSVGGFDKHRRDGHCADLAELGMVERDGVWRTPMDPVAAERLAAMRESSDG